MSTTRSYWIVGADSGLGLALARQLLAEGNRVAVSGDASARHDDSDNLLHLPARLHEPVQAKAAGELLRERWGSLDGLIINAGTCEYLRSVETSRLFRDIAISNHDAARYCLSAAQPLLAQGRQPQVMAILSCYSAQAYDQGPADSKNSLPAWLQQQREHLHKQRIELTVAAPQSLGSGQIAAIPEDWAAESAAQVLIAQLEERRPELVLEVLNPARLWPLPA